MLKQSVYKRIQVWAPSRPLAHHAYHWLLLALLEVSYSGPLQISRWLYTKLDTECDQQAMMVGRSVDNMWLNPTSSISSGVVNNRSTAVACLWHSGDGERMWMCHGEIVKFRVWRKVPEGWADFCCSHWTSRRTALSFSLYLTPPVNHETETLSAQGDLVPLILWSWVLHLEPARGSALDLHYRLMLPRSPSCIHN